MATRLADLVRLDTTGWDARQPREDRLAWNLPEGGTIGLFIFTMPPQIPRVESVAEMRRLEREALNAEGTGLVEYYVEQLACGARALRSITKAASDPGIPLERSGLTYTGWITVPFERLSIVVKAQAREIGPTGVRESMVLNRALQEQRVTIVDAENVEGWVPLPADGLGPLDASLADLPGFDEEFPGHPLTKVRAALARVEETLKIAESIMREAPFPLPTG